MNVHIDYTHLIPTGTPSRCGRFMTIWVWADPEPFGIRTHAACSRQACLGAAEAAYEAFHERQEERMGR